MKSPNRILLWFGIAIAAIVIVTVAIVLINQSKAVTLLPENSPEGVVQRFLQAIQEKDYPRAYGYLNIVEKGTKLSYEDWLNSIKPLYVPEQSVWKATLSTTNTTGNTAIIEVNIDIFRSNSQPLDNSVYSQRVIYYLNKMDNDKWFITSRPELYWLY
jgi:hypothetical protein